MNLPTVTVIVVLAVILTLTWEVGRLALWSARIILSSRHHIRTLDGGEDRSELRAQDGA